MSTQVDPPDLEWIIVDGGSTDGTLELLPSLDRPPDLVISERDEGIYDAMNKGLRAATGQYAVLMNAGDSFGSPHATRAIADLLAGSPDVDILFGGALLKFPRRDMNRPARDPAAYLWHGLPAMHQATVFRTSLHLSYPYDLSYSVSADYAAVCSMIAKGRAKYRLTTEILSSNEMGGQSFSHRHFLAHCRDTIRAQRTLLGSGWAKVALSLARRTAARFAAGLLSRAGRP